MEPLSARNPRVQAVRRLARQARARADRRAFVVEGPVLVAEAISAGLDIEELYAAEDAPSVDLGGSEVPTPVSGDAIASMSTTVTPQPVVAVVSMPRWELAEVLGTDRHTVVLDAVQDPGNAGTILRSAEASGASGVIFGPGTVDRFSPKVVRSSAGSLFRVATLAVGDLAEVLRGSGRQALAAEMHDGVAYDETDLRGAILVMGNEANGVGERATALVDGAVHIPQAGANESLNVAMAATVLCFEAARQRRTS